MDAASILVVDDDLPFADNVSKIVQRLGVGTEIACSAREALSLADRQHFDLAVLDIRLPDGDGLQLLPLLRERSPGLHGLFITGHPSVETAAAAVRSQATDYLPKPFKSHALLSSVQAALERRASVPELEPGQAIPPEMQSQLRSARLAAVSTLASGVAHHLRNPLNAAGLKLAVLRRRLRADAAQPAGALDSLDAAEGELRRLAHIISDFEACIRPRKPVRGSVTWEQLRDRLLPEVEPAAEASGVTIRMETSSDLPEMVVDAERLCAALVNLARNAIDAMPYGGTLTFRVRSSEGGVELEVEDTGPGVESGSPIFDAFFTTKPMSTGLGLTVVQRIVLDHDGRLRVTSRPGQTTFTLYLPSNASGAEA